MRRWVARYGLGAALWLPVLGLALWGGSYALTLASTLTASGTPMKASLATEEGPLEIAARSLTFDVRQGVAVVSGLMVRDNRGVLLVSADRVYAELPFPGSRTYGRVRVNEAFALVERLEDGTFLVERFFPKRDTGEAPVAFQVEAADSWVRYVDRTASPAVVADVRVPWSRVDNEGETTFIVMERASLEGVEGTSSGRLAILPTGVEWSGGLNGVDVAKAWKSARRVRELKDLLDERRYDADRMLVDGALVARLPWNAYGQFRADIVARGERLLADGERVSNVRYQGYLSDVSAQGVLEAGLPGARVAFDGSARWDRMLLVNGRVEAEVARPEALPATFRKALPEGVTFEDSWARGDLTVTGNRVDGRWTVSAQRVVAQGQMMNRPMGEVVLAGQQVAVQLTQSDWDGVALAGRFDADLATGRLAGTFQRVEVDLKELGTRFGVAGLAGRGAVTAAVSGTLEQPEVRVEATGSGLYSSPEFARPLEGEWSFSGAWKGGLLTLDRAVVAGPFGALAASGTLPTDGPDSDDWSARFAGAALDVQGWDLDPEVVRAWSETGLGGRGYLNGTIATDRGRAIAQGRIEGYGLAAGDISVPFVAAEWRLDGLRLDMPAIHAITPLGSAEGLLQADLATQAIEGFLTTSVVQVDRYRDDIVGDAWLESAQIMGTLDSPIVLGMARGSGLRYGGAVIESAVAPFLWQGGMLFVQAATAKVADGRLDINGGFDPATQSGQFDLSMEGVDLRAFAGGASNLDLSARLSGIVSASFDDGKLSQATGQGLISDTLFGASAMPNGSWWLRHGPGGLDGSLEIPGDQRLAIRLDDLDLNAKQGSLTLDVGNFDLATLATVFEPWAPEAQRPLMRTVKEFGGRISVQANANGALDTPAVALDSLSVQNMTYRDQAIGALVAQGARSGEGVWTLDQFRWDRGLDDLGQPLPGLVLLSGIAEERGPIVIDGEVSNLDLEWLHRLVPNLPALKGRADLSVAVGGTMDDPVARASLRTENLALRPGADQPDVSFGLNVDTIEYRNRWLHAEQGRFVYNGASGFLESFDTDLSRGFDLDGRETLKFVLDVPEQGLDQFASALGAQRVQTIGARGSARLEVERNLGQWGVLGKARLASDRITALDGRVDTQQAELRVDLVKKENSSLVTDVAFEARRGKQAGVFNAMLAVPFDTLLENLVRGTSTFDELPVVGSYSAQPIEVEFTDPGLGVFGTILDGSGLISGRLRTPHISGNLTLRNTFYRAPDAFPESAAAAPFPVNPTFDIALETLGSLGVRAAGAQVLLDGAGTLTGSLQRPRFDSTLNVVDGFVQLPTGRITLEKDTGTIDLRYDGSQAEPLPELILRDVQAFTYVTAPFGPEEILRYRVMLEIDGDLLASDDWTSIVRTSSDPDGLSRAQVMSLLGQSDFFNNLQVRGVDQRFISDALTRFALPSFLDPITDKLGRSIGLDYLSVDYHNILGTSATLAKSFGNGLILQARRQLTDPIDGVRRYDVRLSYRIPVRTRWQDRVTLSVGFDHLRPWKVSLQVSKRL